MSNCSTCVWCVDDYTVEKRYKCKFQEKHFDYPKLHGMFCKRHAQKIIHIKSTQRSGQDEH